MPGFRTYVGSRLSPLAGQPLMVALTMTLLAGAPRAEACTTMLVSAGASKTGVPMLAHTVDCWDCDNRVALVPSRDHAADEEHHVFGIGHQYPRITSDKRAWIYRPQPGEAQAPILGRIPEVNHTYALWEANYALMNEHGLSVGESSSAAALPQGPGVDLADPVTGQKGPALFSIAALITLMLSRCTTARCAIQTAGDLAEQHGFYGEGWGSGEALTIVDAVGEAWVFHISADPTHKSAYWAAQRVPEGHFVVIANAFVIREIDPEDRDHFMWSSNLFSSTREHGLWDGEGKLDFSAVLGKYDDRPWYTSTRLYSALNRAAPSAKIPAYENPLDYPWSVQVDNLIGPEDLMNFYRTFYEDTQFDMEKGALGGFFGLPYRLEIGGEGGSSYPNTKGQFARGLSIPRTAYCIVAHPSENPLVYLAMDMPATSVFVPFLASTLKEASKVEKLEDTMKFYGEAYSKGLRTQFSRDSAWWAFDFVSNWMTINFHNMSRQYVYPAVAEWQPKALAAAEAYTTESAKAIQESVVDFWWGLADMLVVRYNDNYFNFPENKPDEVFTIGYPESWLKMVGYDNDWVRPQKVESVKKCNAMHPTLAFDSVLPERMVQSLTKYTDSHSHYVVIAVAAVGMAAIFMMGAVAGNQYGRRQAKRAMEAEGQNYHCLMG